MKKNLFALIFIMCVGIVVSFGICDNKESNLNFMEGNGEQIEEIWKDSGLSQ